MANLPFASAGDFRRRFLVASGLTGVTAALVILAYYGALLEASAEMWKALLEAVGICAVILTPPGQWVQRRLDRQIVQTLELDLQGRADEEDVARGFAALTALPVRASVVLIGNWLLSAMIAPFVLSWLYDGVTPFTLTVLVLASLTGGVASSPFNYYALRRFARPLRDHWAAQLTPEQRSELSIHLPLKWKVLFPVVSVSLATVGFAWMLSFAMANRPVEAQDLRVKQAFLGSVADEVDQGGVAKLAEDAQTARKFGVAEDLLLLDSGDGTIMEGSDLALDPIEVRYILRQGPSGDSSGFESEHSFAWVTIADGDWVLVAATPASVFRESLKGSNGIWAVVALAVILISVAAAWLLVRDLRGTARALRRDADRIASGDLTPGSVIESEDELGMLARTFGAMTASLRDTVTSVAAAAARVDEAAAELAGIGQTVAAATADQVAGIEQATASMASITQQVSGITGSSETLTGNVEEASSSVLELGAAGEELNQTAVALNSQVEEVSSSIEQMIRSVSQVGENTEGLAEAVEETSSSMSEMTRSMKEVDGHAGETARLSRQVVELADGGREKVQETIRGMEAIRDATEAAESVIRTLAGRMKEIGAIVDVIDDVADETNLLALNAAIIAAQSGEQGRAFSVVADEIKDLADRVLSSTKEIDGLIRAVQAESSNAAAAIQRGSTSVQSGVDLSAQAGIALEEITNAARNSGGRIDEIVHAVQEQARATGHVESLMERVSSRVEEIRRAAREQEHGNEVVMRGSVVMRDVAQQTQRTTEEQSRGALRIRDSMESVREAVDQIHRALQDQSASCTQAVSFLEQVFQRTHAHDESTEKMLASAKSLKAQAQSLRDHVRRFRTA